MASNSISTTLEYLTDAAHLMRIAAPETAAHLMTQRSHLMFHHDMAMSDTQRQHVCGACGHIMIPGIESELNLEARRARRSTKQTRTRTQRPKAQSAKTFTKVIRCSRCDRPTRVGLTPPAPASRRKAGAAKAKAVGMIRSSSSAKGAEVTTAPKASTNASSKKRAKNRKAGLQALLAGQQQQKANPLSLADFMKK